MEHLESIIEAADPESEWLADPANRETATARVISVIASTRLPRRRWQRPAMFIGVTVSALALTAGAVVVAFPVFAGDQDPDLQASVTLDGDTTCTAKVWVFDHNDEGRVKIETDTSGTGNRQSRSYAQSAGFLPTDVSSTQEWELTASDPQATAQVREEISKFDLGESLRATLPRVTWDEDAIDGELRDAATLLNEQLMTNLSTRGLETPRNWWVGTSIVCEAP